MAGEIQDSVWPQPKFYFTIKFKTLDSPVSFQEVSGLDTEAAPLEYRKGGSKTFSTIKLPGISNSGIVNLKKGVFSNEGKFNDWFNSFKMNSVKRENVIIELVDESGNPTMTWNLSNAWPTKITGTDLNSDTGEIAIETMELAHEGLAIINGG
ncbi:phage tail protein [Cyclobacterium qasimii]|uniref:Phage tail protein n=2 Tax=Cyclobacterium qasimii TaxID=1350429 RepID=S7VR21_9BACT|nr:phage tail protein [Cyclobacterium qasimii]EPR71817.1 hypothetical protein ADICYQ_0065 [Cyclobacterium qasimii M12-11B]GEO22136.1 hypothetical protein CQA01_26700 [Cyclobacterium qasimii]